MPLQLNWCSPPWQANMFNRIAPKVAAIIKRDMEIITSDGRRAGYVADVASGEIISYSPARRIPLDWIRRVDEDVHIAPRLNQLD